MQSNYDNAEKAYTVLFVTDYESASVNERRFVDTIRYNLLGRTPNSNDGTWDRYPYSLGIKVSVVDLAETKGDAFDKLERNHYDVILTSNRVNTKPIGSGFIRNVQQRHPKALIIPFISAGQIKGHINKDGQVHDGAGIEKIFELGVYSCIVRRSVDLTELVSIIKRGGRTKEEAAVYYGLAQQTIASPQTQPVPPQPGYHNTSGQAYLQAEEAIPESREVVREPVQKPVQDPVQNPSQEIGSNKPASEGLFGSRRMSHRERKMRERQKREEERLRAEQAAEEAARASRERQYEQQFESEEMQLMDEEEESFEKGYSDVVENLDNIEDYDGEDSKFVAYQQEEPEDTPPTGGFNPDPTARQKYGELQTTLQQRGEYNTAIALSGVLRGVVVYADGDNVMIKLDKKIESVGLGLKDIYLMPVVVPYTKFGD